MVLKHQFVSENALRTEYFTYTEFSLVRKRYNLFYNNMESTETSENDSYIIW